MSGGTMQHNDTALGARGADLQPWTPTFAMSVEQAVSQVRMKQEFFRRVMQQGLHYGTIPGTPKPSLWKPGAELLLSQMGLHAELTDAAPPSLDVTGRDHGGEAFVEYRRACTIYRQIGPEQSHRMVIARAEGSCNSWETKYRWRNARPSCPDCGRETVKRRRDGGAWCDRDSGGCGLSFQPGDERINGQVLGKVRNPDVADVLNTILKMADKRAYVAATLLATGCSDIFTQDLSDDEDEPGGDNDAPAGTSRRTSGGNGRQGAARNGGGNGALTAEQEAELRELNDAGPKWSPALLKGKLGRPNGYTVTKAELEALTSGAKPPEQQPADDEEPS